MLDSVMRRPIAPLSSLLILLGLVAGCTRQAPTETARAQNQMLISVGLEPSSLDPHRNTGSSESQIISALWDPLVDWNEDASAVVPAAAESWEISPDGRTYTFHLDPRDRWSNGDPVTAAQWVESLVRFVTPSLAAELAVKAYPIVGVEDYFNGRSTDPSTLGITAPDEHTLVITLREPTAGFLGMLTAYPWLPVHFPSVRAAGDPYDLSTNFTKPGQLISNGPYMLTDWRPNQYVEVVRNPHYPRSVRADSIRFFAIESLDTEERAFRTQQLHLTNGVPAHKIATYREAHDPALRITPRVATSYISFNTTRPPFNDVRVRQAFSLALDRRQLADAVIRTGAPPSYSFVGPVPGHTPGILLTESVDEARRLLAAAGYPDGAGFPPVEYLYNTNERNQQIAEALQQMWKSALGVDISLHNQEWKVFLDSRQQKDFDLARGTWLPWTPEPIELYELLKSDSGVNNSGWAHPTYDALYLEARRTVDPTAREALYHQLDAILAADMPVIPYAYYAAARLVDPSIDNWRQNILEITPWRLVGFKPEG